MLPRETADMLNRTRASGKRIICVGTTSCRTIESFAAEDGSFTERSGWTDIFIYPGYRFKAMDALITNFHLPESTLIMLVSAFAGRENILHAYEVAVAERYRFFSFGDAMQSPARGLHLCARDRPDARLHERRHAGRDQGRPQRERSEGDRLPG